MLVVVAVVVFVIIGDEVVVDWGSLGMVGVSSVVAVVGVAFGIISSVGCNGWRYCCCYLAFRCIWFASKKIPWCLFLLLLLLGGLEQSSVVSDSDAVSVSESSPCRNLVGEPKSATNAAMIYRSLFAC